MILVLASKLASKKPLPLVVSSCLYFNHISQNGFNVQILLVYLHKNYSNVMQRYAFQSISKTFIFIATCRSYFCLAAVASPYIVQSLNVT